MSIAQSNYVQVRTIDGTTIQGELISQTKDSIFILGADRSKITVESIKVSRILFPNNVNEKGSTGILNKYHPDYFKSGSYLRLGGGYNFVIDSYTDLGLYARFIAGYKFNRYLNLGAITGISTFREHIVMPIGIYYEYDFSDKATTPFIYGTIGNGLILKTNSLPQGDVTALMNYELGIGYQVTLVNSEFRLSVGYLSQKIRSAYLADIVGLYKSVNTRDFRRISFGIAYTLPQ